jgi:pantoate--beta-alanine ligase
VQIVREINALRRAVERLRATGGTIALVPTMGALHAGHMALIEQGRRRAAHVVASIFVNPAQFGPKDDLSRYPRREAEDAAMLEAGGCGLLWAPDVATMYPSGHATRIRVAGVSEPLEGAARPGHFDGVSTVVAKLFNQVEPDLAIFGEKDFQQLAVIRAMVRDLDLPVEIVGAPTQRDADGLALSSRNAYLSTEQRIAARALPRALVEGAQSMRSGVPVVAVITAATAKLQHAGFQQIDYLALCDPVSLEALSVLDRPARLLVAAKIGDTRLIDNVTVEPA